METILLTLLTGRQISFDVEVGRDGPAFFALSVRKSGSTIFNMITNALARANGVHVVDVGSRFFFANINVHQYQRDPALLEMLHPANIYGGFRNMPLALLPSALFQASPKLLFVRDPRDALVSEYFSNAYSHPIPPPSAGGDAVTRLMEGQRAAALASEIDDAVPRAASRMAGTMLQYEPILQTPGTKVLKYEDYIFDKVALIRAIAGHFGWRANDALVPLILKWADVRPAKEDPTAFIRKVTPGDHREKLRTDTIARINELLRPAMTLFGYPIDP